MKIRNQNYSIDVTKDNIRVDFKTTSYEGYNVKDLYSDIGYALSTRGNLIDAALPRDAEGRIIQ